MLGKLRKIVIFSYVAAIALLQLNACAAPTQNKPEPAIKEDYTKGVYKPFTTDNVVPYTQDNDEDYYPLYYYE